MITMENFLNWLSDHKFQMHLLAFFLMTLPPLALYFAALAGATGWIWGLIGVVLTGNLLAILTR